MAKLSKIDELERKNLLYNFLKDYYGIRPAIQGPVAAATDNQLRSITLYISDAISRSEKGTIFDVGCGKGIVLARLADIEPFQKSRGWQYVGSDHKDLLDEIKSLSIDLGFQKKVGSVSLDELYGGAWKLQSYDHPHIVIIRNVFHELRIPDTVTLINYLVTACGSQDSILIQDLSVFPEMEEHRACWIPSFLKELLIDCGLHAALVEDRSKSGNRWFTIHASKPTKAVLDVKDVGKKVLHFRLLQFQTWQDKGALHPDDKIFRDVAIAKIDFDLQFTALALDLLESGMRLTSPEKQIRSGFKGTPQKTLVQQREDLIEKRVKLLGQRGGLIKVMRKPSSKGRDLQNPFARNSNRISKVVFTDVGLREMKRRVTLDFISLSPPFDFQHLKLLQDGQKRVQFHSSPAVAQKLYRDYKEALTIAAERHKADIICINEFGFPAVNGVPDLRAEILARTIANHQRIVIVAGSHHDSRTWLNTGYIFYPGCEPFGRPYHKQVSSSWLGELIAVSSDRKSLSFKAYGLNMCVIVGTDLMDYSTVASIVRCHSVDVLLVPSFFDNSDAMIMTAQTVSMALPGLVVLVNRNSPGLPSAWLTSFGRHMKLASEVQHGKRFFISTYIIDIMKFRQKKLGNSFAEESTDLRWLFGFEHELLCH